MAKEAKERVRITVDLTLPLYQRLETLEEAVGASSKADVIREALRLYEFLVKRNAEGYKFAMEKNGERERIVLFD